jgi:hypothetical protein
VVSHAAVNHDRVVGCLHDVALDAEHQLVPRTEESGLQPPAVLVENLSRHGREKLHRLEEWTLLLDDAMNRGAANFDWGGQDGPPSCALRTMTGACQTGMLQPARQVGLAGFASSTIMMII